MYIPKTEVAARIAALKETMEKKGVDAAILARPENVFYYSAFNPILISHPAYVLVPLKGEPCLLVHSIRHDHARQEGAIDNVALFGKWGANKALAADPFGAIKAILGDASLRLGIEGDYASVNWMRDLGQALLIGECVDLSHDIAMQKIVKDAWEIACCRKSGALVDAGVERAIAALDAGATEAEACTEGQYRMRKMWHERFQDEEVSGFGSSENAQIDSLVVWSMANERIAFGCDCPRAYVPEKGDLVLPMAWARIAGYAVENERTVIVGEVSGTRAKAYDAMLKARERIFERLRPGETFESLYLAAMDEYGKAGFGDILPGRCGHGMGLSTHEYPSVAKGNTIPLCPGMIFTVEPGLMTAAWGGVRHSDTVLITETGYESLTGFRRDKIVIKGHEGSTTKESGASRP